MSADGFFTTIGFVSRLTFMTLRFAVSAEGAPPATSPTVGHWSDFPDFPDFPDFWKTFQAVGESWLSE